MLPVPPQIDPEFDLDGVRIELEAAPGRLGWTADGRVFWLFAAPALLLLVAAAYLETLLGSLVAVLLLIGGALATDAMRRA